MIAFDLPLLWAAIISIAVFMYVIMDGFDLGIGILFPWFPDERHRDAMMNAVAPIWDGNETWLVFGGAALFAAFPLAYSTLLTAFYAPLTAMLLALVFRGVAFEFRFRDRSHKPLWDLSFISGSIVATFCQGIVLGAFIQGVEVTNRAYAGGWFSWLTPFSVFTGLALIAGYALLGAGWLLIKTEHELQAQTRALMRPLAIIVLGAIVIVSLWTPLLDDAIASRWFNWPNIVVLAPVPLLVAATGWFLLRAIVRRREIQPFLLSLGLFALSYVGIGISLFPNIIPHRVSIWSAAAPPESLGFLLYGAVLLLPIIIAYTGYSYWVFRGKVRVGEQHH